MAMTCAEAREVLIMTVTDSAKKSEAQRHILTCSACGGVDADDSSPAGGASRTMMSNLDGLTRGRTLSRAFLAIIGLVQLSLALPWLVGHDSWWGTSHEAADLHLTRDGMIALVIAVAALASSWSRRFAWFSFLPTVLAVVIQFGATFYDHSDANVDLRFEWIHLLGLCVVVLLAIELRPTSRTMR